MAWRADLTAAWDVLASAADLPRWIHARAALDLVRRELDAAIGQREALATHMRAHLTAPSGARICCCGVRAAIRSGMAQPCWYCAARTLLAEVDLPDVNDLMPPPQGDL
jgi:hypothetical protein